HERAVPGRRRWRQQPRGQWRRLQGPVRWRRLHHADPRLCVVRQPAADRVRNPAELSPGRCELRQPERYVRRLRRREFLHFAGFTLGTAQSSYDLYQSPASSFFGPPASNTGDRGWKVFAYTAQYGNGFSATFSFEEPRSFGSGPIAGVIDT